MKRLKQSAVLCAVIVMLVPAVPALAKHSDSAVEPLGTKALRSDLQAEGHRNGRLPADVLSVVEGGVNETCFLEDQAAVAWELLLIAAEADGVSGFAAGWCYRSLAQQKRTYGRNCSWVTLAGEDGEPAPPVFRCNPPTAVPGTSNHGWGRAIDVVDTRTRTDHLLNCRDQQFRWLLERGPEFGWVKPWWAHCGAAKQEPWHFEWAGVNVDLSYLIIHLRDELGLEQPR